MAWNVYKGVNIPSTHSPSIKRRYSITADVLSYSRCSIQYNMFTVRKYQPALDVQMHYGTLIHQVLDKAHLHYQGIISGASPGSLPSDKDIKNYINEVVNSFKTQKIYIVGNIMDHVTEVLTRFNHIEGPNLYPRVVDTEYKLQADQGQYILHGTVDVLATSENDPNKFEIWDYKGSDLPSTGDPLYQQYQYQMQVYAELYRRRTGIMPARAILYFLGSLGGTHIPTQRPINATIEVELTPASVNAAMKEFEQTVLEIENCRNFNSWKDPRDIPEQKTCDACDLRWKCTFAQKHNIVTKKLIYP